MIEVEETDGGIHVTDLGKNEVDVVIDSWVEGGREFDILRRVDETITGTTTRVILPAPSAIIQSRCENRWRPVFAGQVNTLDVDFHIVQVDAPITVLLAFESGADVYCNPKEEHVIRFNDEVRVTIGFRSNVTLPSETIIVPPSLNGLAHAISLFGESPDTETPDRSYPSMRTHPPHLETRPGESIDPDECSDRPIRMVVPGDYESLFSVTPLAYYLGARVTVDPHESPQILTEDLTYEFTDDELHLESAQLLRRVFYLDCLVRNVGPFGLDISEMELLERSNLDPAEVYQMSIAERLRQYLDFPFSEIESELPGWPLVIYLDGDASNIETIPYLLDRFSLIFPPVAERVTRHEIIAHSLAGLHRSSKPNFPHQGNPESVLLRLKNRFGKSQGWLSNGRPIDAFKLTRSSLRNRISHISHSTDTSSVIVVLNDPSMKIEQSYVRRIYENRSKELKLDLSVLVNLRMIEMSEIFSRNIDLVHYIGHCDPDGLRCRDGHLSMASLQRCGVQSFFLNACGSYDEGLSLVENGAIAGGVTHEDIVDGQARKVGTLFARLLMRGFSVEWSLSLARSKAILNHQYSVVGDGTHVLTQSEKFRPALHYIDHTEEGDYILYIDGFTPQFLGGVESVLTENDLSLAGSRVPREVSPDRLAQFLQDEQGPMIFNDSLYWPEELLQELF